MYVIPSALTHACANNYAHVCLQAMHTRTRCTNLVAAQAGDLDSAWGIGRCREIKPADTVRKGFVIDDKG